MSSSRRFYYCCLLPDRDNDTEGGLLLHSVSVDLIRQKKLLNVENLKDKSEEEKCETREGST